MLMATEDIAVVLLLLIHMSVACEPMAVPPLRDNHRQRRSTVERTQIVIPTYQFTCHAKVTAWSACVKPGGDRERYDINFQVWRRQSDCYTLVGSNIPPEPLAPRDHCVNYQVPHNDEIIVLPGDVIGFYVDRFRAPRRGQDEDSDSEDLEDERDGGIRLDDEWSRMVQVLTVSQPEAAVVGSELCAGRDGVRLHSLNGAPVITAALVAVQPSTTSTFSYFTTTSTAAEEPPNTPPLTKTLTSIPSATVLPSTTISPLLPSLFPTSSFSMEIPSVTVLPSTTISPLLPSLFPTNSFSMDIPSATVLPSTAISPLLLFPSSTSSLSPHLSMQADPPYTRTAVVPVISVAVETSQYLMPLPTPSAGNTVSDAVYTHHTTSAVQRTMTSSVIVMTSFPMVDGAPVDGGEIPPLLLAGLAIAGVLIIAIVVVVILIFVVWIPRPRKKEKDKKLSDDSDMEYCDAYIMNNKASHKGPILVPNAPMVRNNAYRKCTMLENGTESTADLELSPLKLEVLVSDMATPTPDSGEAHGNRNNYVNFHPGRHDYEEVY